MATRRTTTRRTARAAAKRRADLMGIALIFTTLAAFAAMMLGAYTIDQSRGISVDQSLRSAGL